MTATNTTTIRARSFNAALVKAADELGIRIMEPGSIYLRDDVTVHRRTYAYDVVEDAEEPGINAYVMHNDDNSYTVTFVTVPQAEEQPAEEAEEAEAACSEPESTETPVGLTADHIEQLIQQYPGSHRDAQLESRLASEGTKAFAAVIAAGADPISGKDRMIHAVGILKDSSNPDAGALSEIRLTMDLPGGDVAAWDITATEWTLLHLFDPTHPLATIDACGRTVNLTVLTSILRCVAEAWQSSGGSADLVRTIVADTFCTEAAA